MTGSAGMFAVGRIAALGTSLGLLASVWTSDAAVDGSLGGGGGYWAGEASYSIGGSYWDPIEGEGLLPDKISELTYPLDAGYGYVGGNLVFGGRFGIHASGMFNLSDPSSKSTDSDWGMFSDLNELDIYSESDVELDAIGIDAGADFWFRRVASTNRFCWSLGLGPCLLYRHFEWTLSNLDQWYPSAPEIEHDYVDGVIGAYEADIVLPYLNVNAIVRVRPVTVSIELGAGPAWVRDEDDHTLRHILATTDMLGVGARAAIGLQLDITRFLFLKASVAALSVEASGTEEDTVYGGENAGDIWEIDHDFSFTSVNAGLTAGLCF